MCDVIVWNIQLKRASPCLVCICVSPVGGLAAPSAFPGVRSDGAPMDSSPYRDAATAGARRLQASLLLNFPQFSRRDTGHDSGFGLPHPQLPSHQVCVNMCQCLFAYSMAIVSTLV